MLNGDLKTVKYLISEGADVNKQVVSGTFYEKSVELLSNKFQATDEKYRGQCYLCASVLSMYLSGRKGVEVELQCDRAAMMG